MLKLNRESFGKACGWLLLNESFWKITPGLYSLLLPFKTQIHSTKSCGPPGPPPGQPLSPQEVTTPVARVGAPGALTLIKGYKSNLSSARNVVSLSKACWAHHEPTIIAALDSCFHALGSSRWQQATLPAGSHRAHSTAGHMERKPWSPEPKAGGAPGHQAFRVVPAVSLGGGSAHNPPPGKGGGNSMLFKVERKEPDALILASFKTRQK